MLHDKDNQAVNGSELKESKRTLFMDAEVSIWTFCYIAVFGFRMLTEHPQDFSAKLGIVFSSATIMFFPLIFLLIFGALPMRWLNGVLIDFEKKSAPIVVEPMSITELVSAEPVKLLIYYAARSQQTAQNLYTRAGVYLFIGVILVFVGIAFFYTQTNIPSQKSEESASVMLSFAPRVSILIFIELVAFFFLRQYRAAMDEFRYYEAVQRRREETSALIKIMTSGNKELNAFELINAKAFFSSAGLLESGQSTEILETRKLEKEEIALLDKVVNTINNDKK